MRLIHPWLLFVILLIAFTGGTAAVECCDLPAVKVIANIFVTGLIAYTGILFNSEPCE